MVLPPMLAGTVTGAMVLTAFENPWANAMLWLVIPLHKLRVGVDCSLLRLCNLVERCFNKLKKGHCIKVTS